MSLFSVLMLLLLVVMSAIIFVVKAGTKEGVATLTKSIFDKCKRRRLAQSIDIKAPADVRVGNPLVLTIENTSTDLIPGVRADLCVNSNNLNQQTSMTLDMCLKDVFYMPTYSTLNSNSDPPVELDRIRLAWAQSVNERDVIGPETDIDSEGRAYLPICQVLDIRDNHWVSGEPRFALEIGSRLGLAGYNHQLINGEQKPGMGYVFLRHTDDSEVALALTVTVRSRHSDTVRFLLDVTVNGSTGEGSAHIVRT